MKSFIKILRSAKSKNLNKTKLKETDLVDSQIRIRRDDSSGREIDSLAHQVASDATFLAFQASLDGLQRSAGLLHGLGQT